MNFPKNFEEKKINKHEWKINKHEQTNKQTNKHE